MSPLSEEVQLHFHVGARGPSGYREYTVHYVPNDAWVVTTWDGETEVSRHGSLLDAVREALHRLRDELGEEAELTYGAGCPPLAILRLLGEEDGRVSKGELPR